MKPVFAWQGLICASMLGATLLLQSCARPAAEPTAIEPSKPAGLQTGALTGPVTHVRDGDTIEVAGRPIRLQGLTCDERGTPMGDAATETISRLVAGNQIACDLTGVITYDREVGTCYLPSGVDLASTLILQGACGRCDRYDPEGRYSRVQAQAGAFQGDIPAYCSR